MYVSVHFGVMPYKQAYGITNIYLVGWIQNLIKSISGNDYVQTVGLFFYLICLLCGVWLQQLEWERKDVFIGG